MPASTSSSDNLAISQRLQGLLPTQNEHLPEERQPIVLQPYQGARYEGHPIWATHVSNFARMIQQHMAGLGDRRDSRHHLVFMDNEWHAYYPDKDANIKLFTIQYRPNGEMWWKPNSSPSRLLSLYLRSVQDEEQSVDIYDKDYRHRRLA